MRVFVAIDLPNHVREELEVLQSILAIGRLVPPENLHLTLCFLGEQDEDAIEEAHNALSSIRFPAFELQLAGLDTFGNRKPRAVVSKLSESDALKVLERRVTRSLRNAGIVFEKRRFRPHVTIARLPTHVSAYELTQVRNFLADNAVFRGSSFHVARFQMYLSTLMPKGARHEILSDYELVDSPY